ncbi:NAD(P)/FAD-dependent oxidoreductase [Knoellia subterranea]|uniref:Drug:proton antiporter n=1 Tax=Knoellia subterranea KCTC 19937 TaxID=1385521 RepID=A0A0A0JM60_9MICO|nr:NAD(P)/FAD-dependent oxidoreductase [Knoellia subterranea]KGN38223.1 drug:proton antiporter [Knoellia subterranea KCTC 19937]
MTLASVRADVVVIGAGPAGSAAAAYLGAAGHDVLVLERTPDTVDTARVGAEVVSPRAVAELEALGLTESDTDDWHRTSGVRFVGGGMRLALPWSDVDGRPRHGFVRSRAALESSLCGYAVSRGAQFRRGVEVSGLTTDDAGRITGVTADGLTVEATVVIDASGVPGLGQSAGESASGVAVTAEFESPRHTDDHLETWLELTDSEGKRLPGHGWIVGDGQGRVTVGVGALADDTRATPEACAMVLRQWLTALPVNWHLSAATMTGPMAGARLGTGRATRPVHENGLLRIGDTGRVADAFTGEGFAAALASGRLAAHVVHRALAHEGAAEREGELAAYTALVGRAFGRRRALGRVGAKLIDRPWATHLATTWGLPREGLMKFALARLTTPNHTEVETCVTTSTMGRVTRAAAYSGTERGVDQ